MFWAGRGEDKFVSRETEKKRTECNLHVGAGGGRANESASP
jgi:hypothetical protein